MRSANGPHCPISDHGSRLGNPAYQMYDAWAAYDPIALGTRFGGDLRRPDDEHTDANKALAISFAAYRALVDLFPTQQTVLFDPLMESLGYDPSDTTTDTSTPTGIGNVAAAAVLAFRHTDGSNQLGDLNPGAYSEYPPLYDPVNGPDHLDDPESLATLEERRRHGAATCCRTGGGDAVCLESQRRVPSGPAPLHPHDLYQVEADECST